MTTTNEAALEQAQQALAAGRLDEAETRARAIAGAEPETIEAWHILVQAMLRQGRPQDAGSAMQEAIAKNPQSAPLFVLLGDLLLERGRLEDALTAFEQARNLAPHDAAAALGLAGVLMRQARHYDAIEVLNAGAKANPDQPRFALQMGRVQLAMGEPERAIRPLEAAAAAARKALAAAPDDAGLQALACEASAELGALLYRQGKRRPAANHLDAAVRLGAGDAIKTMYAECVGPLPLAEPVPSIRPMLEAALIEAWTDPSQLVRITRGQIRLDPDFAAAMQTVLSDEQVDFDGPAMERIAGDRLLRALMMRALVSDAELERLLTHIRRALLRTRSSSAARGVEGRHDFAMALAAQCFFTDYAWQVTAEEETLVAALRDKLAAAADAEEPIAMLDLVALAAYLPLDRLDFADKLRERTWPPALSPLLIVQLREPQIERELAAEIAPLTPIADETSAAVRAQYEESPFPRWIAHHQRRSRVGIADWLARSFPNLPAPAGRYADPAVKLDVLVAGCGTGRDAIAAASRFANADVLAIDLSLTSLGYAARKAREAKLGNLTFGQADILEIEGLGRQFDIVECGGVLHHLSDPVAGWRELVRVTKPGGYMMMALYSELGRRDIDPAIELARQGGYGSDAASLRRYRAEVLALPPDHPVRQMAERREDFFNLAMLRDLVFHVHEERFTTARIAAAVEALGVQFAGFVAAPESQAAYTARFGVHADPTSLENWRVLEEEQPHTFAAMYHFLVAKPED